MKVFLQTNAMLLTDSVWRCLSTGKPKLLILFAFNYPELNFDQFHIVHVGEKS